jgi:hypothetical protein
VSDSGADPAPAAIPQHELWRLRKDGAVVRAVVRQVPHGTEVIVFHAGDLLWSEVCGDSRTAGELAEMTRADWLSRGYRAL